MKSTRSHSTTLEFKTGHAYPHILAFNVPCQVVRTCWTPYSDQRACQSLSKCSERSHVLRRRLQANCSKFGYFNSQLKQCAAVLSVPGSGWQSGLSALARSRVLLVHNSAEGQQSTGRKIERAHSLVTPCRGDPETRGARYLGAASQWGPDVTTR